MHYIRIWYKSGNRWFYETYDTNDGNWKESFLILKSAGAGVKIQYLNDNKEVDTGLPQGEAAALCV